MRTITIIETGDVPVDLQDQHGSYPKMFEQLIGKALPHARFRTVRVMGPEALPDPASLDALLITGSPAGVYDDLDWIAPLEAFIRQAHERGVPMVGICFGHQLIAQALGGTVTKSDKGWGIGRHVYDVAADNGLLEAPQLALACSHQDQVIEAPSDARTIMSSPFTPHAGLLYDNGTTFSVQAHPEFSPAYALALCVARKGRAPDDVIETGKTSLDEPLDSALLGEAIARFLTRPAKVA